MADERIVNRDEVASQIQRLRIAGADDSFIARTRELTAALSPQLARLHRDFEKTVEPAHVFAVPLR